MQKTVVVSFEGEKVNIVYATKGTKSIVIDDALTVADAAFDAFLEQEKTRNFIVVNSFTQFFCDTITLPPAPDNLLRPLIENEVRKIAKMQQFACIHAVLGDRIVEQKKMKEVFVFAVEIKHIRTLVERFTARGKVIDALYPDIFALAGFVGAGRDTVLGVLETQTNKHLFVVQAGQILFVRVVQAFEPGMRDHDMQNITMTLNYCRQNLRLNPQRIVLVGHLCRNFFVRSNIGVPMVSFTHPVFSRQIRGRHAAVDFMLPIAALFADKKIHIDLLPAQDRALFRIDRVLRYVAGFFCLVAVAALLQAGFFVREIVHLRRDIINIRRNLPDIDATLAKYTAQRDRFNNYRPLLESYRRYAALPDTYELLRRLADVPQEAVALTDIAVSAPEAPAGEQGLDLTVQGMVRSEDFAQMQRHYQAMVAAVKGLPGFSLSEQSLDLKTQQWRISGKHQ